VVVASPISTLAPAPAPTRRHLEYIATSAAADRLKASLRRSHPRRSSDEIDDALQDALLRGYARCEATDEDAVWTWLWRTADKRLQDRGRSLAREVPTPDHSSIMVHAPAPDDPQRELERADRHSELVELFEALSATLSARQRAVLALHARGRKRPAVATELGVSERVVKRQLENVLSRARALLVDRCGGGCEEGATDVWRLAFGLASSAEVARAQLHLHLEGVETLGRVTVSTIAGDWVEGRGTGYARTPGASCFHWARTDEARWSGGEPDITSVINGAAGSIWGFGDTTPRDADGWQVIPIEPAVVQARLDGQSHGFSVMDDVGSEYTRTGNTIDYRHFPNRYVTSREGPRKTAPYFTLWLESGAASPQSPARPPGRPGCS